MLIVLKLQLFYQYEKHSSCQNVSGMKPLILYTLNFIAVLSICVKYHNY